MALSAAEKKKLQRQRDRALGWVEVSVKVASEHVDTLRAFALSLPPPALPKDPRQLDLIERIEADLKAQDT